MFLNEIYEAAAVWSSGWLLMSLYDLKEKNHVVVQDFEKGNVHENLEVECILVRRVIFLGILKELRLRDRQALDCLLIIL